jgi:YD repeat-containing protein
MSSRVSRRSVFARLAAAALAPLAARVRAAFARGTESAAAAEQFGAEPQPLSVASYSYDALGRSVDVTDRYTNTTKYRYDSEDRLIEIIEPGPVESWTYCYEGVGR